MTENKARKRAIRTRMAKTGERYTAARRNVAPKPAPPPDVDLGQSDEAVLRGSGKTWAEWFEILDAWGAASHTPTEIARYINQEWGVPGWWAQSVRVGYERGRGLRSIHQRSDNQFYVTVSKTLPVGVDEVFARFTDTRKRNRWLAPGTLRIRTSQPGKSARFDFRDGTSRVHVYFTAKGGAKTTVSVSHERLDGNDHVEQMRAFWKEHLAKLAPPS